MKEVFKNKGGRPKKPEEEKLNKVLHVYYGVKHGDILQSLREKTGMSDSELVRWGLETLDTVLERLPRNKE